jgi:deoxyribonuclease IV
MSNFITFTQWEIGAHVGFSKQITPTIIEAIKRGMYTTQFFMGNPKSKTRQRINGSDIDSAQCLLSKFPMNVFTHFPYIANLNGSVKSLAWSGDSDTDNKLMYTLKELEYELNIMSQFSENASGVVIHPGCYPDSKKGLKCIATSINKINFNDNAKLVLENCAGEGRKLCKNFSEIRQVIDQVNPNKRNNVGVCIDTAHIWGQGDYDLREVSEIDRMFSEFEQELGMDRFTLLHLNDSKVPLGSKKDRHECVCTGEIWGQDHTSLVYLLDKCEEHKIPVVLETTSLDIITLNKLYEAKYE